MGAWGFGLLQNDDTQDGLLHEVRGLVTPAVNDLLNEPPSPNAAGRLAGVVGLLLQLQMGHWFDPDRAIGQALLAALERHAPAFSVLPKTAIDILGVVRAGKAEEVAQQEDDLPDDLRAAFFAEKRGRLGVPHAGLFEYPASAAWVQEVADHCVEQVAALFASPGEPPDFGREAGDEIAALCILLQLEPCRVVPELFCDWWQLYRAAEEGWLEGMEGYEIAYRRCLWRALNFGWLRFSGEPKPAALEVSEPPEGSEEDG